MAPIESALPVLGVGIALAAAFCQASVTTTLRRLQRSEHISAIVFWFAISGIIVGGLAMPLFGSAHGPLAFALVIAGGLAGGLGQLFMTASLRAPVSSVAPFDYLQIVAATNFKQRIRKTVEYFHADRLNYAVVCTPNLLEYDQGFFVKNGDGSADIKPIAHLYKTQVYAMARHLGLPSRVVAAVPTTDTYSLPQGQDEFYFALPYAQMDLALWALEHGRKTSELASALKISESRAEAIYADIENKRRTTQYLHLPPLLMDP